MLAPIQLRTSNMNPNIILFDKNIPEHCQTRNIQEHWSNKCQRTDDIVYGYELRAATTNFT